MRRDKFVDTGDTVPVWTCKCKRYVLRDRDTARGESTQGTDET